MADVLAPYLVHLPDRAPMIDVREALPAQVYQQVVAGAADVGVSPVPPPRQLGEPAHRAPSCLGLRPGRAPLDVAAQALAAAGRGVAVVSDDPRHGPHGVRIRPGDGALELRVPLDGARGGSHYAAAAIEELVGGVTAYARAWWSAADSLAKPRRG